VAYPIICYPDSPYWRHLRWHDRARQRIKNALRGCRLRRADKVVVETPVMARRIERYCGIAADRLLVLPPAPSAYLRRVTRRRHGASPTTFLFFSGASPHKNLWRLPAVAAVLLESGAGGSFRFLLSCGPMVLEPAFAAFPRTRDHFDFHGPVAARNIQEIYERADVLVNLSDLESFSNNYMEAWRARIPILASDRDFSREICRDSAVYCEPHDARSVAARMLAFIRGEVDVDMLVAHGAERLAALCTQETRMAFLRQMLMSFVPREEAPC
jgi:glycosyltransferase involved in cell wall biosynthesis